MTTDDIYDLLADSINEIIPGAWSIARLNVQYLVSGHETEFEGVYLTASGEVNPLPSDFPIEVIEAIPELYTIRENAGHPRWNRLHIALTATGDFTIDFTWDQEIQDEDDHFMAGGTVAAWEKIRVSRYGASPE